jgi:photosystem II stability/assembly factor-like uncharacterized protein
MRSAVICLSLCAFAFSWSAAAQPGYLISIEQVDQGVIDHIRTAEIDVYAKAGSFWIAGATQPALDLLTSQGVVYRILDSEADIGEHYLIYPKPGEEIGSALQEIRSRAKVLAVKQDVVIARGNPREIEKLAWLGFGLRKMHRQALPVEPLPSAAVAPESAPRAFDPLISEIISGVDQTQLLNSIDNLSGEDTVLLGGAEDSIKTRYSYSQGSEKAAYYLKQRFEEMTVPVEFDTFRLGGYTGYLLDVVCSPSGQKTWLVDAYGGVVMTADGGCLWEVIEGTEDWGLYDLCRVDDDTLWSVGYSGAIIRSTDEGETWESRSLPEFESLNFRGCCFQDANSGWVVGDQKILYTSDGGVNWTEQVQEGSLMLYAVDFVNSDQGWAVGDSGVILHTTDGGANWNAQSSPVSARFRSVDFVDSLNGWACGDVGCAIYTTDGGANWTQKTLATYTNLNKVFFLDGRHGWMVGFDGSVLRTSDLGANWVLESSGGYLMYGVGFADTLTGWATGYDEIRKTTDGGRSWSSQFENLQSIVLLNVVATIQGSIYPDVQVLITGHYDDVSEDPYNWAPGADDNGSGTVSLLAAADALRGYQLVNTVKMVAFCGEEQGLLGSAAYAQEAYQRGDQIAGVLNFDMIAWDGNGDGVMELHSGLPLANQDLADILIGAVSDYGLNLIAQKITSGATNRSDHASFWDYDYPAILGIEDFDDFNPYYHSTGDRAWAFDTAYYVDFTRLAVAGISILADPFMVGDANSDGTIDVGDAIYLLNYLFKNGPLPDPPQAGDANGDLVLDVGDAIYLLNYLFKAGPPPVGRH